MASKPVPRIDATSAPFWAACNEGRVLMQRCTAPACRKFVYYPRVCCPHCQGGDLAWTEVSGRGRIVTYTRVHRPHHEGFAAEAPYLFGAVALDEGPLVYGRIHTGGPEDEPSLGDPVAPVFVDHAPDQKLLAFRVVRARSSAGQDGANP